MFGEGRSTPTLSRPAAQLKDTEKGAKYLVQLLVAQRLARANRFREAHRGDLVELLVENVPAPLLQGPLWLAPSELAVFTAFCDCDGACGAVTLGIGLSGTDLF